MSNLKLSKTSTMEVSVMDIEMWKYGKKKKMLVKIAFTYVLPALGYT